VWLLFATWCTQINWAIASPFGYGEGYMPDGFSQLTIQNLLDVPDDTPTAYEPFADNLISGARMIWPIQDQDSARNILHGIIERMVIDPMVDFGVARAEYGPHKILGKEFSEIKSFKITCFGKRILESIRQIQAEWYNLPHE
jgi:hypothetical protein